VKHANAVGICGNRYVKKYFTKGKQGVFAEGIANTLFGKAYCDVKQIYFNTSFMLHLYFMKHVQSVFSCFTSLHVYIYMK
jgi:hypothetical protein